MDLRTSIDLVGTLPVLTLSGAVDLSTVPRLQDGLQRLLAAHGGQFVAVDLDAVDTMDDAGLGILLGAAGRTRQAGGDLVVVCATARLRDRFALTGLDRAIEIVARLADVPAR